MDLGLRGRFALVAASSAGLGYACASALARDGAVVVLNGRDEAALQQAAQRLRDETGADVRTVAGDVADPAVQQDLVDAVPQVDILVNNNGGPPFRDFREVDRDALLAGVTANMAAPVELVQRVIDGMIERRFGRIVSITSFSVKMPIAGLDLSSGARAGLTGFLAGVARDVASANVTINFMMPGYFATDRLRSLHAREAAERGVPVETVAAEGAGRVPAGRFGDPDEFGAACAFLCSQHAGYITGQSLLIDGGAYPGIL
ncbi:SDR family oxidoreductase [Microbacterium soli]|uniref:SDR family oxidoreductase n=1 Tax=Microbacterium soli TaxID=446075 RepID=A0ABP7NAW8_9MICO